MSVQSTSVNGSLTGLARRWLKTQIQVHGNPQRAYRDRQEAEVIEREMRERAGDELGRALFNAVVPLEWKRRISAREELREDQERQREERRRSAQLALPRADVTLTLRGSISGTVQATIPASVAWPGPESTFVTVELEAVDPIGVAGRHFSGLRIALPARDAETGAPVNLSAAAERFADDWDPLDAQIWFDDDEDTFFWSDAYGSAHLWPSPGLDMLQFLMPVQNAAGERVSIEGTIAFTATTPI